MFAEKSMLGSDVFPIEIVRLIYTIHGKWFIFYGKYR